jgi:hypothetical protein
MLRGAFSVKKDLSESTSITTTVFDYTGRKLSFAIAQNKLREKLGSRKRIPVFYMVSRAYPYFFAKKALLVSFAKQKFWKSLRSKQRKLSNSREQKRAKRHERASKRQSKHLTHPQTTPQDNQNSIGEGAVFKPVSA